MADHSGLSDCRSDVADTPHDWAIAEDAPQHVIFLDAILQRQDRCRRADEKISVSSNWKCHSLPELPPKGTPEILLSYAWGDDSSEDARERGEDGLNVFEVLIPGALRPGQELLPGDRQPGCWRCGSEP